ncbi:MAG TPA: hypothetical protein ENI86_17020 [Acidimicrobiales bacterium]|nr:hypothetical protein [Acidimicrobiales bacterium]
MSAPPYVPHPPTEKARTYHSPPHVPDLGSAPRPAEIHRPQPHLPEMGYPGPDQGFALKLVHLFEDRLVTAPGEHTDDIVAGVVAVALKRASIFGRAPVVHDLTVAFELFGFLDEAPGDLVEWRRELFEGVGDPHHYRELRDLVDLVPEDVLRRTPEQVAADRDSLWRSLTVPTRG